MRAKLEHQLKKLKESNFQLESESTLYETSITNYILLNSGVADYA